MDSFLRDIRFGLKLLVRERAFALAVLLTLSICIGANVAIFSVVNTVVLRPLPYDEPDGLVTLYNSYPGAGVERGSNSAVDYFLRRERIDALGEVAAYQGSGHTVGEEGSTERIETMRVTPSFFPLLGVDPILGRTFTEQEMEPGLAQKAVLTYGFWQERFGGSPDIVGRDLRVDGQLYAVIGVLPEDFRFVGRAETRFFVPIAFTPEQRTLDNWHNNNYQMIARLRPGATAEQAEAQIAAMNASLVDEVAIPNARQLLEDTRFRTRVVSTRDDLLRDVRPTLFLLWAGVGFVLLIGCVNIANLMLTRSHGRARELATRLALGAQRVRLGRQILTEAAVTGVLGGILGAGVGALGLRLVSTLGLQELPRGADVALDGPVLAFTLALALVAALLFGSIPAIQVLRGDLNSVFREEGRTSTVSRKSVWLRSGLVTGQVAVAFLLLVGAGLMFRSFRAAAAVDPGFEPDNVLTALVALPDSRYPDGDSRRRFAGELLSDVEAIPGVRAASVTSQLPFSGNSSSSVILPEGHELRPGESILSPFQTRVGPRYFDAMGIRLLEGRTFRETDGPDQPNVIIIDEWLARRYWPDASALGQRMVWGAVPGMEIEEDDLYTIIGVVETIKQNDLTASEHVGAYYFSYRQQPFGFLTLVIRTGAQPDPRAEPGAVAQGGVRPAIARSSSAVESRAVRSRAGAEPRAAGSFAGAEPRVPGSQEAAVPTAPRAEGGAVGSGRPGGRIDPAAITPAVRQALARLDPELPLFGVRTLEERVADSLASRRTTMVLLLVFAGVALLLGVVGIYGMLAYSVTQRTRELGIRIAIGSAPDAIFRLVLKQGLRVTALGLAVGGLAALGMVRLIRSLLFGVGPADPTVLTTVALLLTAAAAAACALPAYRATRVDPVAALGRG